MSKKVIIFFAEYGVLFQGGLLIIISLQKHSWVEEMEVFVTGGVVLLLSLTVAKILKHVFRKYRPGLSSQFFKPRGFYAFPSGHATGLASVSSFITRIDLVLGFFAWVTALLVMYARVKAHVHDVYDMVGGVIVGLLVTYYVTPIATQYVLSFLVPSFL
ncbi:MAG: phosphatase PAP2 family protein [Candidatus Pacebacteria bacterium]|nr:phosphatase PAP2 family protein [Candidatus Paceibacterota bacterium]